MNYSHDNWSAILAHIGKPEELDTSARNAGALTRRREIRDAATLLRLGLAYGPGGMSLREVTAWAQLHDVATLSDVALLKRLRNAADWFGILAAQTLAVRAAVTGCTSGKRLRLVDGTAISAPGGGSAEWRLHMGYDPHTCQFIDRNLNPQKTKKAPQNGCFFNTPCAPYERKRLLNRMTLIDTGYEWRFFAPFPVKWTQLPLCGSQPHTCCRASRSCIRTSSASR